MAYSLDQSRAMIAARDKHERVLQIGQQRRSNPLYYLAEPLVQREGVTGEITIGRRRSLAALVPHV